MVLPGSDRGENLGNWLSGLRGGEQHPLTERFLDGGSGSLPLDYSLQLEMRAASCCSQICVCICAECKQIRSPPRVVWCVFYYFYYAEEGRSEADPPVLSLFLSSHPGLGVKSSRAGLISINYCVVYNLCCYHCRRSCRKPLKSGTCKRFS